MVPKNATASDEGDVLVQWKREPGRAISPAPASSRLRRSCRGAKKPTASVSTDEPSSAAVATIPICSGL